MARGLIHPIEEDHGMTDDASKKRKPITENNSNGRRQLNLVYNNKERKD